MLFLERPGTGGGTQPGHGVAIALFSRASHIVRARAEASLAQDDPFVYRGERIHPGLRPVCVYRRGAYVALRDATRSFRSISGSDFCWVHTAVSFRHVVLRRRGGKKAA